MFTENSVGMGSTGVIEADRNIQLLVRRAGTGVKQSGLWETRKSRVTLPQ